MSELLQIDFLFQALLPESFVTSNPMLKKSILLSTGILANKIKMMFIDMRVESAVFVPVLHRISQVKWISQVKMDFAG